MNSFIIILSFILKFIVSFPQLSFDFKCRYLYTQIYFFRGINNYLVIQNKRNTILYDIHEDYNESLSFFDTIVQAKGTFNPTVLFINDIIYLFDTDRGIINTVNTISPSLSNRHRISSFDTSSVI